MALYFITGSKNKVAEVKAIIPDVEQLEADLPEIQHIDPRKILEAKLAHAKQHHNGEYIVEDTSLYIDGMNGLPGPLIKWFLDSIGPEGLYKLSTVFGAPAVAKTIIGYSNSNSEVRFFEGEVRGTLVEPPQKGEEGWAGFGWDAVFKPEGHEKTFGQMSREEKNSLSMRASAARKLKEYLDSK